MTTFKLGAPKPAFEKPGEPQNKLTIGYKLDGQVGEFTCTVNAFRDLENATKALQLHLIEQVLGINTWVETRENIR